ncbi:hypothetical protein ACN47E_007855 [Coniothyrium glycines]
MKTTIERPRTPPTSGLLSPPSTGGFDGRYRFTDLQDAIKYESRSQVRSGEGESLREFFEERQEGSDVEIEDSADGSQSTSEPSYDSAPATPCSIDYNVFQRHSPEDFDSSTACNTATQASATVSGSFPFMRLPPSVRKSVYEHLLVVPALISVRHNYASYEDGTRTFPSFECRELLSGIGSALMQRSVNGYGILFSRFASTNVNILCANREVYTEARAILYGENNFEIIKPTEELSPSPNFRMKLFPSGCQCFVTKLHIRIRSFYDLHWLLGGGYNVIKNHYRALCTLTLILELDSTSKGFGKQWSRLADEKWVPYVMRLQGVLEHALFKTAKGEMAKSIPYWIDLRVLFNKESYYAKLTRPQVPRLAIKSRIAIGDDDKREHLRQGLVEAWELFKKGGY